MKYLTHYIRYKHKYIKLGINCECDDMCVIEWRKALSDKNVFEQDEKLLYTCRDCGTLMKEKK